MSNTSLIEVVILYHERTKLTEDEIVVLMTAHFEHIIQETIQVQYVTTLQDKCGAHIKHLNRLLVCERRILR